MYAKVLKSEMKKNYKMITSYPLNAVITIIISLIIIVILLISAERFIENVYDFYGMFFLPMISTSVNFLHNQYKFDTLIGVTDQIITSKIGMEKTYLVRYLLESFLSFISSVFLISLGKLVYGFHVSFPWFIISFILITFYSFYLSKFLLGLTLLNRNIDSVNYIVNIIISLAMVGVSVIGFNNIHPSLFFIPFASLVTLPYFPFEINNHSFGFLFVLLINVIFYSSLTEYFYQKLFNKSLREGSIGQY